MRNLDPRRAEFEGKLDHLRQARDVLAVHNGIESERQARCFHQRRRFALSAATKPEAEYGHDGGKNCDHVRDDRAVAQKSLAFLGPSEF